jgi:hypothetical protein
MYSIFPAVNAHRISESDKDHQPNTIFQLVGDFCATIILTGYSFIQVLIRKREKWTRLCLNLSLAVAFAEVFASK